MLSKSVIRKTAMAVTIISVSLTISPVKVAQGDSSSDDSDDSEPSIVFSFLADLTWYDPALCDEKPINCMGDPMRTAGGHYVPDWYERGIACPSEFPLGTIIMIEGYGELTCIDRGGSIILNGDGVFRFDLLHRSELDAIPREIRSATATFNKEILTNIFAGGNEFIPFVQPEYLFSCPATTCDTVFYYFGQWIADDNGESYQHLGVDFWTGLPGIGRVYAAAPGVVTYSAQDGGCGGKVRVDHQNGWETGYCHLTEWYVDDGDYVYKGQLIGRAGWSGYTLEGQHVHMMLYDYTDNVHNFLNYLWTPSGFSFLDYETFEGLLSGAGISPSDVYTIRIAMSEDGPVIGEEIKELNLVDKELETPDSTIEENETTSVELSELTVEESNPEDKDLTEIIAEDTTEEKQVGGG